MERSEFMPIDEDEYINIDDENYDDLVNLDIYGEENGNFDEFELT